MRQGDNFHRNQGAGFEPGSTSPKFTPEFVLRSCKRWWKVATPLGLLCAFICAVAMTYQYVPLYRSSAWLRVEEIYIVFGNAERSSGSKTFMQTQIQLIHSPLVLEQVLARPDIAQIADIAEDPTPVSLLSRRINVNAGNNSELFIIDYLGPNAEDSAKVANAVVEAYFRMHTQDEAQRSTRVVELLEDERARRMVVIQQLRDQLKEIKIRTFGKEGDDQVSADESTLVVPLAQLHGRITAKEVEQELLKAQCKAFEEKLATAEITVNEESIESEVQTDEEVKQIQSEIKAERETMNRYLSSLARGAQDPRYQQMAQHVLELERSRNEKLDVLREKVRTKRIDEEKGRRFENLAKAQTRIAQNQLEIDLLREKYFKQREEVNKKAGMNLELSFKHSELRREESVVDMISGRIMRLRTEMTAPAKVTLLRKAEPSSQPDRPFPTNKVVLYAFVCSLIPFGLAVLWEKVICRVDGPQQLWQADLTVVGEVARLPVSSRFSTRPSSSVGRDVSLFEESIDSLRTCLVLSEHGAESRVLVVTSAVSGEGKTSVASQLAVSIARASGEPTLLIDADMRSPDVHNVFDVPNEPGLAQVLSHECTIDEAIITSWSNYVHIMPAGVLRTSPHKLLGDGAIKNFMAEVSSRYKHVIIDTSPILSASESLVLAKAADATLLCAMRDVSRVDQVQKAYERLLNIGARPLGTVLNGVPTNRYAYLYGVYAYARD